MKTLKQLTLAILLTAATFGSTFAGGHSEGQSYERPSSLMQRVESLIHLDNPAHESFSGQVEMFIRITENGRLEIIDIHGDHDSIVEQVRQDVDMKRANAPESLQGRVFRMVFNYATPPSIQGIAG